MEINLICSTGKDIGVGHVSRLIAIHNGIVKKFQCKINFYIDGESLNSINHASIFPIYISLQNNLDFFLKKIIKKGVLQIFIFDLKESNIKNSFKNIISKIHENNGIIISIDSFLSLESFIDYYFMPTFLKKKSFDLINQNKISWGWNHFLLNTKYQNNKILKKKVKKNLLVLTGGSDTNNLGNKFPSIIDKNINKKIGINWVVGPYSKQPLLEKTFSSIWKLEQSPKNLDDLMINSNYAITVYGVSFFELLYYGIPTVVFSPYGNKDKKELEKIKEYNIAMVANDELDAICKLNILMEDTTLSNLYSMNAKKLFTEKGEDNLTNIIKKIISEKWLVHI